MVQVSVIEALPIFRDRKCIVVRAPPHVLCGNTGIEDQRQDVYLHSLLSLSTVLQHGTCAVVFLPAQVALGFMLSGDFWSLISKLSLYSRPGASKLAVPPILSSEAHGGSGELTPSMRPDSS